MTRLPIGTRVRITKHDSAWSERTGRVSTYKTLGNMSNTRNPNYRRRLCAGVRIDHSPTSGVNTKHLRWFDLDAIVREKIESGVDATEPRS